MPKRWRTLRRQLYCQINIMPNRYIEIPKAVAVINPENGKPVLDENNKELTWDFDHAMHKLLSNPLWGESFPAMRSQEAIAEAWKIVKESGADVLPLAEEDWNKLKQAVETPRTTVMTPVGAQAVPGFGINPTYARYMVSLLTPIMDAKSERPKKKDEAKVESTPRAEPKVEAKPETAPAPEN